MTNNLQQATLMECPSIESEACAVCGRTTPLNRHHIVPRSQGGTDGPTVVLCGNGNHAKDAMGRPYCHGLAHAHKLHFRNVGTGPVDGWQYAITGPCKDDDVPDEAWHPFRERLVTGGR